MAKTPKTRESISVAMRFFILRRDNYTCRYCGAKAPDAALHVDHVTAAVNGGTNDPDNLVTACIRCNLGKGTLPAADTATDKVAGYYKHFWLASIRYANWANTIYVGGSPECRLLLMLFADYADPFGNVEIDVARLVETTSIPGPELLQLIHGLTAVGYIGHARFLDGYAAAIFALPPIKVEEKPTEHIPRRSLQSYDLSFGFSPVRDIHG